MSDNFKNAIESGSLTRLIPVLLPGEKPKLTTIAADDPAVAYYDASATASVRLFSEVWDDANGSGTPKRGIGSGSIVSSDGLILTCGHVVQPNGELTAELYTGEKVKAKTVAHFPEIDMALVQISGKSDLHYLKMSDSNKLKLGEGTAIFGHPNGSQNVFVSVGEVTGAGIAKEMFGDKPPVPTMGYSQRIIRLSSHAEPGSSGSPLVNKKGDVVGVTFAGISGDTSASGNEGAKVASCSYAMAISELKKSLKSRHDLYKKLQWH